MQIYWSQYVDDGWRNEAEEWKGSGKSRSSRVLNVEATRNSVDWRRSSVRLRNFSAIQQTITAIWVLSLDASTWPCSDLAWLMTGQSTLFLFSSEIYQDAMLALSCGLWGLNRGPHVLKDHAERKELGRVVEPGSRVLAYHVQGPGFDPRHILPIQRGWVWPHMQGWVSFVRVLTTSLSIPIHIHSCKNWWRTEHVT